MGSSSSDCRGTNVAQRGVTLGDVIMCDDKDFYEHALFIYEPSEESGESIAKDLRLHAAALLSFSLPLPFRSSLLIELHATLNLAAKSNCPKKSEGYIPP